MDAQRSAIEAREAPFDSEDEPSPDNFFQKGMRRAHKKMLPASITEGDAEGAEEEEYEYGDVEAHSGEEDGSDYSIHQFIAKDEARDPEGSDDTEADAASMDAQRSAIEAREAPFDSEDEPSPDNFFQKGMKRAHKKMLPASITEGDAEGAEEEEFEYGDVEAHSGEEDGSDYSIHQFIAKDEARDPEGSDDTEADAASMDAQRSAIEAREAPFDSEDEPSPDNFLQKRQTRAHKKMLPRSITEGDAEGAEEEEYEFGDVEAHSGEEDGSDYSIHQFIAKDEARDPEGSDDTEADAASMDAQRSAIEAREAPFDSEDEPSPDNFLQKGMKRMHKKMLPASITEGDAEGAEEEEYEYGDVEAHSGEEDGSDYSIHQFIAKDEARDPEGSDDTEADAASMDAQRSAIEAREAPFDSEDEPSPDN
jgi:hypothetical protein